MNCGKEPVDIYVAAASYPETFHLLGSACTIGKAACEVTVGDVTTHKSPSGIQVRRACPFFKRHLPAVLRQLRPLRLKCDAYSKAIVCSTPSSNYRVLHVREVRPQAEPLLVEIQRDHVYGSQVLIAWPVLKGKQRWPDLPVYRQREWHVRP